MTLADDGGPGRRDTNFVRSLERGLAVIEVLSGPDPLALSEVARATGLTRATARRFLLTLQQLHYVREDRGRFSLTPQVLKLGYAYLSGLTLPEIAGPHLTRLAERVHESSSVSVLDGTEIVYVARVSTHRIMKVSLSVGTRLPAYATSMGRVLLAGLDPERRAEVIGDTTFARLTPQTVGGAAELSARLERVQADGYALVDQELEQGLRSIAAPIRGRGGDVIAAINLSVHAGAMTTREMRSRLLPPLRQTADAIAHDFALAQGGAAAAPAAG